MTDRAPDYVHRILDAYLTGDLLDLQNAEIPDDVEERLERTFGQRQPQSDARASSLAYSGAYHLKGTRATVAISGAWPWPVARLLEVHDGDTVKLAIDHGFGEDAKEWVRLKDVWAPEVEDPGGSEATEACRAWFAERAPNGYVQVTTFRTSAPLEIRFRQSFTRYIGVVTALDGSDLNGHLISLGYTA